MNKWCNKELNYGIMKKRIKWWKKKERKYTDGETKKINEERKYYGIDR